MNITGPALRNRSASARRADRHDTVHCKKVAQQNRRDGSKCYGVEAGKKLSDVPYAPGATTFVKAAK